uniref:Putative membrane-associated guanylate kinase-interacting protein/connector enhancer of ksr n=1 Tax=Nyssomyia neivai TaxID=330878 RepID=A0A1L8DXV9_9DIPT
MTLWRINVAEWSSDQVVDWLKGLDNSMYHYVNSFTNNEVGGQELLSIRPYILEQLGMYSISHQEIVLEAVKLLRNFHFNLDKENLQYLALQLATQSWSLHKQLTYCKDKNVIETNILKEVTSTVATIKPLIGWLDRPPFKGQRQFNEIRTQMLRLALEMATSAHRDRFADEPVNQIQTNAEKLAKLGDYIIQDITDPMLLQPASLLLVTLKKKESDLGFNLMSDVHGVHKITDIRYNSPAHLSGKIEEGDEIVQINYQTVVGWQHKKVLLQLHESKPDVLLTLKKRPKHMKIYGQIYMKPYRLPSKKRAMHYRWGETLPSPRAELLSINDLPLPRPLEKHPSDTESDSNGSDILTPTEPKAPNTDLPHFLQKLRPVLQRRNTICGDQTSSFKNMGNVIFWQERKDKSVSFGHGLEIAPRPSTFMGLKGSLPEIMSTGEEKVERKDCDKQEIDDGARRSGVSKVVRFDADLEEFDSENNCTFNVDNTVIETFEPIPYVDDDVSTSLDGSNVEQIHMTATKMTPESGIVQAINTALITSKEAFRKSTRSSTSSSDDDDTPPAIEPRKDQTTPPAPPPRPKKNLESSGGFIRPANGSKANGVDDNKSKVATVVDLKSPEACQNVADVVNQHRSDSWVPSAQQKLPTMRHFREEPFEALELFTPPKTTKGLTLKKKNSILAKRRKVTLKCLTVSDIQGHLYRRTKDKSGAAYWAKGYFVLVDTALYGFKVKDAAKANCLIFLSGYTVSLANEVHSKANAFKVYHTSKTFYFAAETPEALGQWMEFIRNATLKGNPSIGSEIDIKEIFTETESSDDDLDLLPRGTFSYGSTMNVMSLSMSKVNQECETTPVATTKQEKYHLGFGSLKKFTKSNLPFSKSAEKKSSPDIPTPTAQFRSYRKVINQDPKPQLLIPAVSVDTIPVDAFTPPHAKAPPVPAERPGSLSPDESFSSVMTKKTRRPAPLNYIHASNPNLVDFDFHTSKTIDFAVPKISNTWEGQHSLQGFMTLKDLMLQKQAEDAKEVYNNRVFLGMEKKDERGVRKKVRKNSRDVDVRVHPENPKFDKIQSRSLPKTPDYAQSFKPDDVDIIMTRSKEGLKLRDFGYEFISGDDPQESKQKVDTEKTWPKRSDKVSPTVTSWSKKKGTWITTERRVDDDRNSRSGGSFKKFKPGKFDNILTTSDKMFSFKDKDVPKTPLKPLEKYAILKPVSSYTPVTLPGKKSNLQISATSPPDGRKVHVKNDLKENLSHSLSDSGRKGSVERSASYFTKLSFNAKVPKEKKLLGSPRLHRALFGRQNSTDSNNIFEAITFPPAQSSERNSPVEPPVLFPRNPTPSTSGQPSATTSPDYPHLEYPPVFEPETYSLSDPSTSLTLLRRRNKKNK